MRSVVAGGGDGGCCCGLDDLLGLAVLRTRGSRRSWQDPASRMAEFRVSASAVAHKMGWGNQSTLQSQLLHDEREDRSMISRRKDGRGQKTRDAQK
jgi:hypothetical protein